MLLTLLGKWKNIGEYDEHTNQNDTINHAYSFNSGDCGGFIWMKAEYNLNITNPQAQGLISVEKQPWYIPIIANLVRYGTPVLYIALMILIIVTMTGCHRPAPYYMYEVDSNPTYEQQRTHDQILQHGAGGCTPNMSTGGCL